MFIWLGDFWPITSWLTEQQPEMAGTAVKKQDMQAKSKSHTLQAFIQTCNVSGVPEWANTCA